MNSSAKPTSTSLAAIASSATLDHAYTWLCKQRKNFPVNADIWHFRHHWAEHKQSLIDELLTGRYQFRPQQRITLKNGKTIHLWSSKDSLVMKAMTMVLEPQWPISPRCTHVQGNGGLKGALRWLHRKLPRFLFVFRSDVKGYYQNIDHSILLEQLDKIVPDQDVMRLLDQVVQRIVEWGGTFKNSRQGIGRGSSLSPLFAALYLKPLDDAMEKNGIAYVRYMDDWIILATNRHKLRRVVKIVNATLSKLMLTKHPDKTWMGKIDRGFDFLGYHHTRAGLTPASNTLKRFRQRLTQLYEQGASSERIGAYQERWGCWVKAGLSGHRVLVEPYIGNGSALPS